MIKKGVCYSFKTKEGRNMWLEHVARNNHLEKKDIEIYIDRPFNEEEAFRAMAGIWIVQKPLLSKYGLNCEEYK